MKIVCISDTHNKHKQVKIPECDMLIHAGDFSSVGHIHEVKNFLEWFSVQPAKHKIFISGNHDFLDHDQPALFKEILKEYPDVIYLRDEGVTIEGLKIWGRPWTPKFFDWAFMVERGSPKMRSTLALIPEGLDILITHGPALNILDETCRKERVGCEDLANELERIKPRVMVFGHIHHSHGVKNKNGTKHVNAAVLNDQYIQVFTPIEFEL